jgi:hypothetical protein
LAFLVKQLHPIWKQAAAVSSLVTGADLATNLSGMQQATRGAVYEVFDLGELDEEDGAFTHASEEYRDVWLRCRDALDSVGKLGPDEREWDGLLRLVLSASQGHLVAALREKRGPDGKPTFVLDMQVLDRARPARTIERLPPLVRWGPINTLLAHGAAVVLLSATPLSLGALAQRLDGRIPDVVPYPETAPRPGIRLALERAARSVDSRCLTWR